MKFVNDDVTANFHRAVDTWKHFLIKLLKMHAAGGYPSA